MQGRKKIRIEEMEDIELSPSEAARAEEAIAASEKEEAECRVNFRWQKEPLSIVKRVAELMGIPYQNYIKQVLFRQAAADLRQFADQSPRSFGNAIIGHTSPQDYPSAEHPTEK